MIRSYLASKVGKSALTEPELEKMAKAAWQRGWAVFRVENIADPWVRQVIINEANRMYGGGK